MKTNTHRRRKLEQTETVLVEVGQPDEQLLSRRITECYSIIKPWRSEVLPADEKSPPALLLRLIVYRPDSLMRQQTFIYKQPVRHTASHRPTKLFLSANYLSQSAGNLWEDNRVSAGFNPIITSNQHGLALLKHGCLKAVC